MYIPFIAGFSPEVFSVSGNYLYDCIWLLFVSKDNREWNEIIL